MPPLTLSVATPYAPGEPFRLIVFGPLGSKARIQRSTDLRVWEDWRTLTLGLEPSELTDTETGHAVHRFYRAVVEPRFSHHGADNW